MGTCGSGAKRDLKKVKSAENICATVLLLRYPLHMPTLASANSAFTTAKWIVYSIAVITAVAGGLRSLLMKEPGDRAIGESSDRPAHVWPSELSEQAGKSD